MTPWKFLTWGLVILAAGCGEEGGIYERRPEDQMTPRNSLALFGPEEVTFVGVVELGEFILPAQWVEEAGTRVECNGPDVAAMEFNVVEVLWGTPPDGPLLFPSGFINQLRPAASAEIYEKYVHGRHRRVLLSTSPWKPHITGWSGTNVQPSVCGFPAATTFYVPRMQSLHPDGSERFLARAADVTALWRGVARNGWSDELNRQLVDDWEGWVDWNEGRKIALEHYGTLGPSTAQPTQLRIGGRPASAPADSPWYIEGPSYCFPDPATGRPTVCSSFDGQCTVVGNAQ